MKITMHNKDHIARMIADSAWQQKDDAVSNSMLRVSDALTAIGTIYSSFRTLKSFETEMIPAGEEKFTDITYKQALNSAMVTAGIN